MAAATIASRKFHHGSDVVMYTFNLTSVADGDTIDTNLGEVDNVIVSVKTSGTPQYAGWASSTVSGQIRITFDMSGTADLIVTVLGR